MTIAEPTFSLIVNTIDRAMPLRTLLRALEHQSYPHFEVIVVVGPTHDNTHEVLSEYADRVRVLNCPTANLSESRNIGLLAARGDIVAYIDDDAVPCRNWFAQLARLFRNKSLDGTGGVVYTVHPNYSVVQHRIGVASSLAEQVDTRSSPLEYLIPPGRGIQWVPRMMGTNLALRRHVLLEVGGFDEFFPYIAEETDLIFRLTNAGRLVLPVAEMPVYHVPASSRNRQVFTNTGRWWLRSRSRVYFAIKNGLVAGDAYSTIALRCLMSIGAHGLWYLKLWRARQLKLSEMLWMDCKEILGGMDAVVGGLFGSRKLIDPERAKQVPQAVLPITPFQNEQSQNQSSPDPISGERASVTWLTSPLRVCLLSGNYPPHQYDGIGRHTNLMARGLFELGHAVHVIARGEREQISFYQGAYVHRITSQVGRYENYRQYLNLYHHLNYSHAVRDKLKRLMLNDGIQIVDSPLWQFEGLVANVERLLPMVVRLQTSTHQIASLLQARNTEMALIGELERLLVRQSMHRIPNSQATWQQYSNLAQSTDTATRYTVIPHGIEPVPEEATRPFDPARPPKEWTVLFVGRLEKRKGILDLFQAIPRVLAQYPRTRFIIVGADNSQHDGFHLQTGTTYAEYLARHFQRYVAQVEFKGAINDDELQKLYAACDLFVAPSLYESFGLIYLEAMNYAKPVIGCRAGGIPEVVMDGVTGKLVEPEAPAQLAEAIISALSTPKQLREWGLAGRARLLRDFTYLKMADAFARVYRQVIAGG